VFCMRSLACAMPVHCAVHDSFIDRLEQRQANLLMMSRMEERHRHVLALTCYTDGGLCAALCWRRLPRLKLLPDP